MVQVKEIIAKSILTPQKVGSLAGGFDFSLNPYAGCAFKCSYCYVPKFPSAKAPQDWGNWVEVKKNAPELIRKERALVFGSRIFFSSATDPYQYLELKYRLSRACLKELLNYGPKSVLIHTRSHLVLEDLDLLKAFGERLSVGVSITTDDDAIARQFEPKAPSIKRRLDLIKTLHEQGVRVKASLAPLLPHDGKRLVSMIAPYVESAWLDEMRWPEINTRPELLQKYSDFFAPENYAAQVRHVEELLSLAGLRRS